MLVHSLTIMVMTPVTDVEIISNKFLRRKCLYIEETYILGNKVLLLLLKKMITMVIMVMMGKRAARSFTVSICGSIFLEVQC